MTDQDGELAEIAHHFDTAVKIFRTSPLYRQLSVAVAGDPPTLELLRQRQPGQQPSYLLFGAVHYLLLSGVDHPLRAFYPSLSDGRGVTGSAPGAVFIDFVRQYHGEVRQLARTRLVQTNVIRRSVGLRYALSVISEHQPGPVHLIEVGASAGLHLRLDSYRFAFGRFLDGPSDADITIRTNWGDGRERSLNPLPRIASRTGVDLRPVDVTDPDQRLWLRALVWPENTADADLLRTALTEAAVHPVKLIAGDAIDVCPGLAKTLPAGETRVVFHAATRMHVPTHRRAAFDHAVDSLGQDGPLYHVWQEPPEAQHVGIAAGTSTAGLFLHGTDPTDIVALADMDGHGAWITPLRA